MEGEDKEVVLTGWIVPKACVVILLILFANRRTHHMQENHETSPLLHALRFLWHGTTRRERTYMREGDSCRYAHLL